MIQENGVVVKVDSSTAWVETQRQSACASCSAKKGCGSAVLSEVLGRKRNVVQVALDHNNDHLRAGDTVILGMQESALVKGSFAVYIVPLLLMLFFALIGETINSHVAQMNNEVLTLIFALVGFVVGYFWLKRFAKRNQCNQQYHPIILSKSNR